MELETKTSVQRVQSLSTGDLQDLCDAAEAAIRDGGGFGWTKVPSRQVLESYFQGLTLVPERELFVGRVDKVISASVQLHFKPRHNEAQEKIAQLYAVFVAPWARGLNIGSDLLEAVEAYAKSNGLMSLQLDVRETQEAAIHIYEKLGYERWAENPYYAFIDGKFIKGYYYQKVLLHT